MAKKKNQEPVEFKHLDGRWYYKKDGKAAYNIKEPLSNILADTTGYEEITKEEWDELTYVAPVEPVEPVEPTAEEIHAQEVAAEIAQLKRNLFDTDYIVIKIAEDPEHASDLREEYAEQLANRITWRARINELEAE